MHESAVARDLVAKAVDEAHRQGAVRVTTFHVLLGPEGHLDAGALALAVAAASEGTLAEGAAVETGEGTRHEVMLVSIDVEDS